MTTQLNPSATAINNTFTPPRRRHAALRAWGAALLAAAAVFAPVAEAVTTGMQIPAYRGLPGTEHSEWDRFLLTTDLTMPILRHTGTGDPTLSVVSDDNTTFVTGSGNLYTSSGIQTFTVMDSVAYDLGIVTFQTRTLGSELDYANVTLTYDLGMGVQSLSGIRTELSRAAGFGQTVVSRWDFNILATGQDIQSYKIHFASAAPNLSLDSVRLDTASRRTIVPDGGSSAAMLALGTLGLIGAARRKK